MPKLSEGQVALGFFAALAIWLFGVLPFLYGPPPRFAESSHKQQPHSAEPAQQPDTEPRGTAREPFFVQVIPANKAAHEADDERREREQKSSNEWWLMLWTGVLALVTGGLVLVAGVQAAFFLVQLRYMRDGMVDAKEVASAAKVSADAALKSAKTAEAALIANDRAWISIKAEIIAPLIFKKDRVQIGIGFDLINVGKSPATHVDIWAEFCPDLIEAKEQGRKAASSLAMNLLDFGVVLFPEQVKDRDWLEMEMPTDRFKQLIAEGSAAAKERGEEEWTTAWPVVMACATYRLAGSPKSRHTVILFEVRHTSPGHLGWDGSECETNLTYLKLVQTYMSGQVT